MLSIIALIVIGVIAIIVSILSVAALGAGGGLLSLLFIDAALPIGIIIGTIFLIKHIIKKKKK